MLLGVMSLIPFDLEYFLHSFLSFNPLIFFFKIPGRLFGRMNLKLDFSGCLLMIRFRLNIFRSKQRWSDALDTFVGLFTGWTCPHIWSHHLLLSLWFFEYHPNTLVPPACLSFPAFTYPTAYPWHSLPLPCPWFVWVTGMCISGLPLNIHEAILDPLGWVSLPVYLSNYFSF